MTRVFIQARMTSRRFPGKVLAPLAGRPVIQHLLEAAASVVPADTITVLTSATASDDVLADFVEQQGLSVFRGAKDDVFGRFRACLRDRPCDRFVRLSADSPLLDPTLLRTMIDSATGGSDLVTNVHPRTFPKGWSVEVVDAATFAGLDAGALTPGDREHVTRYFYRHSDRFRIVNVRSADPRLAAMSLAVETRADLDRIEGLLAARTLPAVSFA